MKIKVLFFAAAREEAGTSEAEVELDEGTDTKTFLRVLEEQFPRLQTLLPRCALARNGEYVQGDEVLAHSDEVALIPPVSGG
mmetsp:Transcript_23407/g.40003  ORF Transcript_23407/g.40003 Transcript_23407/m.40003 type:complete len:82 (-) Transcript_23407:389-634(-)